MVEIIEALNQTSGWRAFFYIIAFLSSLAIVEGIATIVKHLVKLK